MPENLRNVVRPDRRTVIGREATAFRATLLRHCGTEPTGPQRALIELAVQLRMRLLAMDLAFVERGEQSAHDCRQYLAWANTLARTLQRLGLQPPVVASKPQTLQDYLTVNYGPPADRKA
jgi:hypothetical protein